MNLAYLNEIHSRLFVPCTNLAALSKDIPDNIFMPFEYIDNNGFYGIDVALKQYVGLPQTYHLKVHYSHCSILSKETSWIQDYNTLPMLLTWSPFHESIYKQLCKKPMHSIGPIIHYAKNAYTKEKIEAERKRLGKNALFFPTHSTHHASSSFSVEKSLQAIGQFKEKFDSIRICLYWKDVLDGRAKLFLDSGYECVTAGHMFDPYFLPRIKGLLSVADHTFGNAFGTNIAYAVYLQKPFTYIPQEITYSQSSDNSRKNIDTQKWHEFLQHFLQHFCVYSPKITSDQYKLCDYYFGYSNIRTREELATLLQASETLFNSLMKKSK